jgi:hypothetical protein
VLFETGCQGGRGGGAIVGYGFAQYSDRMWTVFYVFIVSIEIALRLLWTSNINSSMIVICYFPKKHSFMNKVGNSWGCLVVVNLSHRAISTNRENAF